METFIGLFVHVHVHDSGYLKRIVEVVPRVHEGWYSVDVEYQQGLIKFQICEFGKEDTVITLDNLRDLAILLRNVLLNGPYVFISLHDNLANFTGRLCISEFSTTEEHLLIVPRLIELGLIDVRINMIGRQLTDDSLSSSSSGEHSSTRDKRTVSHDNDSLCQTLPTPSMGIIDNMIRQFDRISVSTQTYGCSSTDQYNTRKRYGRPQKLKEYQRNKKY